ncbi:hypothetical protein SUGI_1006660 [Cryptomeria japonica]|nr:hypothetical protein SUGI_1006660 [Cryptomeria japonica]
MLPHLIRTVRQAVMIVTGFSDPTHGNTINAASGLKTQPFDVIRVELKAFSDVHEEEGSHVGGIYLEMTGQNMTMHWWIKSGNYGGCILDAFCAFGQCVGQ